MVPGFVQIFSFHETVHRIDPSAHGIARNPDSISLETFVSDRSRDKKTKGRVVLDKQITAGGWLSRIRAWFPDREFFMRSDGQVRFITISSKLQITAAAVALAVLVIWTVSMGVAGWTQYRTAADRLTLLDREAKVATAEDRVDA